MRHPEMVLTCCVQGIAEANLARAVKDRGEVRNEGRGSQEPVVIVVVRDTSCIIKYTAMVILFMSREKRNFGSYCKI